MLNHHKKGKPFPKISCKNRHLYFYFCMLPLQWPDIIISLKIKYKFIYRFKKARYHDLLFLELGLNFHTTN